MPEEPSLNVAVIGTGYWGRNHVRNFDQLGALTHICDSSGETLDELIKDYPHVVSTTSYDDILSNPDIKGVVIATPAATHYELALRAIDAGKDLLVEKPLALDVNHGERLVEAAERAGVILMVGHILLYHPAVIKLKQIIDAGDLGKIQYIQSNRLSMGKVRYEENILWSFAPHDISIILYLLGEVPVEVRAFGSCHLQKDVEDVTVSILDFPDGVGAHIYVSWMNPFKEHRLVVVGDSKMAVFEDSLPDRKLRVFHRNFHWVHRRPVPVKGPEEVVEFEPSEPLRMECLHFLECMRTRQTPRSDGREGLRTLKTLQQCYESMKISAAASGPTERLAPEAARDFFAHETAVIDEPCLIGKGTKIWHFSHVMPEAEIGDNCNIGQNVVVGKGVKIGNVCKIQNNVSIYEGVELGDYVFCGPSMVFTNVYNPRCEIPRMKELRPTRVGRGATIGANATIVCGHEIGEYAFIGAGAVTTKDVAAYALMLGNPARRAGWMCRCGNRLAGEDVPAAVLTCPSCSSRYQRAEGDRLVEYTEKAPVRRVPLLDLKRQYATLKAEIKDALDRVVESQVFIGGPEVEALEKEVAEYCGCRHAVGVSSGTDALLVALMALGVSRGDEVITTPFTFFATAGCILRLGAKPVFVDIDPVTFNIDPAGIARAIGPRTKAIMPVHLFGQCADMDPILELARDKGVFVVEDAAQAIGSEYKGRPAGSMGTAGCFSFFPSKNLGSFGDGGMVTTNDPDLAERIRVLRNHGAKPKYFHKLVGGNFRLDALQAAALRVKLKRLDQWHEARRANAAYYTRRFQELGVAESDVSPPRVVNERHIFNQYVILAKDRDGLKGYLQENGVATEIYYPRPIHLQECLDPGQYRSGDFPVSETAADRALALPIFPELTDEEQEYVVTRVKEYYGGRGARKD
jgi:UDP-2-acetamido-3-amino-2,3-dideoxy-glucuronate N-acetyltransferase